MRFYFGCVLAGSLAAVGCGDDGQKPPPPTTTIPTSDVTGSLVDVHVTDTGDVQNMRDPQQFAIAAIYASEDGSPKEIAAIIEPDGTFRIPQVPEIPYDLRFVENDAGESLPPRFILNAPRTVNLGRVYLGRPDAVTPLVKPTELKLTASNLEPWSDGNMLDLFSLGAGAAGTLEPTNGIAPADGATSLTNYAVDISQIASPKLIDGDKGDIAVITQHSGVAGSTAPYRSVRKVFELPLFTQKDGVAQSLSGTFVDLPLQSFSVSVPTPAFLTIAPTVHSTAKIAGKNIRIFAEPGTNRSTDSAHPTLMNCEAMPTAQLPPSFSYGNPFPPTWTPIVSVDVFYEVTHTPPTDIPKKTYVSFGKVGPVESFAATVTPEIVPATNITINDQPAQQTLIGTGYSPKVKFDAPATGNAAVYIVAIRKLDLGGGGTTTSALLYTKETSLQIPEGLLDFGFHYYLRVAALVDYDEKTPFQGKATTTYASALTDVFTP